MRCTVAFLLLLLAPAIAPADATGRIWQAAEGDDHQEISQDRLAAVVAAADIVLLGEIHDQAADHRRQAQVIEWAAADQQPGLVFEMLGPEQVESMTAWREQAEPAAADFGAAVRWEERGWPDWSIYQPIVASALRNDLSLDAGAPSAALVQRVARNGAEELDPERRTRFGLDRELPDNAHARLRERIESAHGGIDSPIPTEHMIAVQRMRDAAMARALVDVQATAGAAILIAGREHVRHDYGVPLYLDHFAAGLRVISIGLFTAAEDGIDNANGKPKDADHQRFDYAWVTAPVAE